MAAVRELPEQQRFAVVLYYVEDRSVAEVADILQCSEGSVKTHLSRARAASRAGWAALARRRCHERGPGSAPRRRRARLRPHRLPTPPKMPAEGLSDLGSITIPRRRRASVVALALVAAAAAVVGVVVLTRPSEDPVVSTDTTASSGDHRLRDHGSGDHCPADHRGPGADAGHACRRLRRTPAPFPTFGLVACCGERHRPGVARVHPCRPAAGRRALLGGRHILVADDPAKLGVSVRRLVPCADGVRQCNPLGDGTYGADEVGLSDDERTLRDPARRLDPVELLGVDPAQIVDQTAWAASTVAATARRCPTCSLLLPSATTSSSGRPSRMARPRRPW